jgi:hypothetical protein
LYVGLFGINWQLYDHAEVPDDPHLECNEPSPSTSFEVHEREDQVIGEAQGKTSATPLGLIRCLEIAVVCLGLTHQCLLDMLKAGRLGFLRKRAKPATYAHASRIYVLPLLRFPSTARALASLSFCFSQRACSACNRCSIVARSDSIALALASCSRLAFSNAASALATACWRRRRRFAWSISSFRRWRSRCLSAFWNASAAWRADLASTLRVGRVVAFGRRFPGLSRSQAIQSHQIWTQGCSRTI